MSLELIEKNLETLEREILEVRRTQLLMIKTWVRLTFNDNIPFELTRLMAELERRVKSLEKDMGLSMPKSSEKP